jgi:hypothetical protein
MHITFKLVCACVCVCVCERERERERNIISLFKIGKWTELTQMATFLTFTWEYRSGQGTSNPRDVVIFSVTEDKCQDTTSN